MLSINDVKLGDKNSSEFLEKEVQAETYFQGFVFTAKKFTVELPDGSKHSREVVLHNGGSCIAAMREDGKFILVRQYRFAVQQELLEFPAGKIESHEQAKLCAIRELEEECGYQAKNVLDMGYIYPTCGYSSEKIYLYFAKNLIETKQHLDDGENLSVVYLSLDEIIALIEQGKIHDGKTVALAYKIKNLGNN